MNLADKGFRLASKTEYFNTWVSDTLTLDEWKQVMIQCTPEHHPSIEFRHGETCVWYSSSVVFSGVYHLDLNTCAISI